MASISWTGYGLPVAPQKNFSEEIVQNLTRTGMDAGPAKQRRIGLGVSTLSVSYLMTTSMVSKLETFCTDIILGTVRFDFPHPRTGNTVEARIVPQSAGTLFTVSYAAPGYYNVSLKLEILP